MRKIVISISVLLALALSVFVATTVVRYRKTVMMARESVLKDDLVRLRAAVKDYSLKHESLPQSLDDLVKGGFVREIPIDPITEKKDWQVTEGELQLAAKTARGIVDVHSASTRTSSFGTVYNKW